MSTGSTFPTTLDTFTDKADGIDDILAVETNAQSSAIEELEAKIGINTSAVTTSWDYKLRPLIDPSTGTQDQVLVRDTGETRGFKWASNPAGFADPMTTRGDIIVRNSSNVTARLALGAKGSLLKSDGSDLGYFAKGSLNQVLTNSDTDTEYKDILQVLSLAGKQSAIISFAEAASTDGFAAYLSAGGTSSLTTSLLGSVTPFVAYINGVKKTVSSNLTVAITAGFGSNNTLAINEASWTAASSQETQAKVFGEKAHPSVVMNFDTAGSNISGLSVGDKVVFRAVNSSAAVEYIYCEMVTVGASGTLRILWRAIDSSGVRITFRDNDVWTLCRTNWIFTDGTSLYATTVHPVEVDTLPSAGTAGKYILLKSTDTWYLDNGSTVAITDRILVGASMSHNTTDNGAVAYFPEWGHFSYKFLNMKKSDVQVNVAIDNLSTSKGLMINGTVRIGDKIYKYKDTRVNTATAGDRIDSTADIAATGIKYLYVAYSTGKLYVSDVMPRKWDEGVLMHTNKMYRCMGAFIHDASKFLYFDYDQSTGLISFIEELITGSGTSISNFPIHSGFFPSYIRQALYIVDNLTSSSFSEAESFTGTGTKNSLPANSNGTLSLLKAVGSVYSGYVRFRSGAGGDIYLAGYYL